MLFFVGFLKEINSFCSNKKGSWWTLEWSQMKVQFSTLIGIMAITAYANNINTGGLSGINKTYSAYSIGEGSYELGASLKGEYGHEALHERLSANSKMLRNVNLYSQDIFMAYGLTNWMDLALDLPFYEDVIRDFDKKTVGLGDLSAAVKIMHPGMKSDALIRLAYIMRASFPTGDPDRGYYARDPQYSQVSAINTQGAFTSDGYSLNPMLAWTFDLTRLKMPKPILVHVNFGMDALFYTRNKTNIPQENSAMLGNLAVEWLVHPDWSLFLDFYGKSRLINITEGPFLEVFAKDQLNLALGTKKVYKSGWSAALSFEGSLSTQENFTQWSTNHKGDGAKNYSQQPTPIVGMTLTIGFGQTGKAADPDFDNNPNATDKCPNDAEDYDSYEDADGCPDPVHKAVAPLIIKDTVVVTLRDTVTVVRNDTVRIAVVDTLAVKNQQDPNAIFGFGKTTFPAITFKTGSDSLNQTSFKTLNDIAQSIKNFPDVTLQVIGYTDNTGSIATNKALSASRAQAVVNYLVKQGASATHLQPIGMGSENPAGNNQTAEGRLLNRRVEFKRIK
jgi:outer membrane protein OmpA-like peptidoglycan-associated protein